MRTIVLILSLAVVSLSCTSYQPKGFTGGFSETQLAENVYRINFLGNAYTSQERAADFALLRAAELTLESGYSFYVLIDSENRVVTRTKTTPSTSRTDINLHQSGDNIQGSATTRQTGGRTQTFNYPTTDLTVMMFVEKPTDYEFVYEARFISQSIKNKYDISD